PAGEDRAGAAGLRTGALRPRLNRRCSWAERPGLGRRPSSDRAHAARKRCPQRQSRPSIFRHYRSVGGRQGACVAATGSWTPCSRRSVHAELWCPKTAPILGSAARRSALRENRRLPRTETELTTDRTDNTDQKGLVGRGDPGIQLYASVSCASPASIRF